MALRGAELLIYPTAIGWESSDTEGEKARQHGAWETIQRGHAIANGLPVITVNRVGFEADWSGVTNGIQFWGQSFVAGPQGEFLFKASVDKEENVVIEIDKQRTEDANTLLAPVGMTVEERYQQWIAEKQAAGKQFTADQLKWLDAIKDHIASSLNIEQDDLEEVPFNKIGGMGRAYELFGEELTAILDELNMRLAA